MKKLLTGILLLSLSTLMLAEDIDMNKSKGTEQSVIVSLTPPVAQMYVDKNVIIKVVFDVDLEDKHVKKNDIKLKKISDKKKKIKGEVDYLINEKAVTFTPIEFLKEGFYEIEFKSLKTTKENKHTKIKEIKYRFYVPEVVNGYKLPLEPDATINNATLLGVDSNSNGIRDDVERFIVIKYKDHHKIVTEIGFQGARVYQMIVENPLNTEENYKDLHDAMDCNHYYKFTAKYANNGDSVLIDHYIDSGYKNLQLNTKARVKAYLEYDKQLSGGVYSATPLGEDEKRNCNFDVNALLGSE